MRIDRLVPAVAGLAMGFGVLLVMVDVADTAPTGASGIATSTAPNGSDRSSGSTGAPTLGSVTPTQPTSAPTTLRPLPTTTLRPVPTTTLRPVPATTDPADSGDITFDPRCIGRDLGADSSITGSEGAPSLLDVVRLLVVDRIVEVIQLPVDDRSELEDVVGSFDLRRCTEMLEDLEGDVGEVTGWLDSQAEAWLCAFAAEIAESDSLAEWLEERGDCPQQRDDVPATIEGEDDDGVADRQSPTTSDTGRPIVLEGEP